MTLPITLTGGELLLSGSLTSLDIFNVVTGSANFALSELTVSPTVGGSVLTGATLITVAPSDLRASAGAGGFGVSITGGDIGIALLEAGGTDTRYWVGVTGSGLAGSLSLGGSITASVTGLSLAIGSAGNGATAFDWATTFTPNIDPGANIAPTGSVSLPITANPGEFSLSGSLTGLNIFNVITGSAGFALSESTVSPTVGSSVLTGATLITLALSNLQASAGAGGFGVSITGGDIGIAVLEAPTPASGTDNRYWIAVTGSSLAGSLSLGGSITATVSGLMVSIDTAGGTSSVGGAAAALDWKSTFAPNINPGANLSPWWT